MENDIIEALEDMGYEGPMLNKEKLLTAVEGGPRDIEYTKFVSYLSGEIRNIYNLDEHVNAIKSAEDSISFLLELSSFLKELGCPYVCLSQGAMADRLISQYDKLLLLDYLVSELLAAHMVKVNNPDKSNEVKSQETPMAADFKLILLALKFNKPPPNISPVMLFQKVQPKLQEIAKHAGDDLVGRPLFNNQLSEKQWDALGKVQKDLHEDYTIRREMLLTRLDCTIQSFQWSERLKGKEDQIVQLYHNKRKCLKVDPEIDISDLLAGRDDLAVIEKISTASVRKNTRTALNKVIIGQVPDRGGRPNEQAPPPPEMPSWQQRSNAPGGRGGGRGGQNPHRGDGHSRGGGNYQQNNTNRGDSYGEGRGGGYQQSSNYSQGGSYSQQGSNYSSQSGNSSTPSTYGGGSYNQQPYAGGYTDRGYGNRGGQSSGGRSYESFQHNKTTYADQYVQDSQQNQQFGGRGRDSRGQRRGRSNYNRGNYR